MAMLRLARRLGRSDLLRLVVSVRSPDDLYYGGELPGPEVSVVYTREAPAGDDRPPARLGADDLKPAIRPDGTAFVCGSAGFAEAASRLLVGLGIAPDTIRVERFGPTGAVAV
jgi:ferredoxin-NADP reductase